MGEGITGSHFLGNKLTEEQKQQSLIQAFSILGLGAASKFIGGKPANIPFNTYSKQYAQATAKNAQNTIREIGKQIGKVDVPVGVKVLKMAGNGPIQPKVLAVETKTLSEVKQGLGEKLAKKNVERELSGGSKGAGIDIYSGNKTLAASGEHFTNGRKNRLKPNIKYKTGEYDYFYETDSIGRIVKFETVNLQLTTRTERLPHSKNTPGKIKGQDHAGHLAGDRFGGSPKIDNLVSQLSDVNLKLYKRLEEKWATTLKEVPPKKVTVDVEVSYVKDNMRPEKFKIKYTIDGKWYREVFIN